MLHIIQPGKRYDFLGIAPLFIKISVGVFVAAVLVLAFKGLNLGLDFKGGHEVLLRFDQPIKQATVRARLDQLFEGVDTQVQAFEVPTQPDKTFFLVRIERSQALGDLELKELTDDFKAKYGDAFEKVEYNKESGDMVRVFFNPKKTQGADLSDATLTAVVEGSNHKVRQVRPYGRTEQKQFEIQLRGVDVSLVNALKGDDASVAAVRVEFVGPTIGRQLRDDGILAVLYAIIFILIYVAIRFDLYYSPGAILCLVHDAVITTAFLSLIGQEFTLATIAGLLTLVGYSINDTIVVFDRIRETVGKAQGEGLKAVLNRAVNETLGRTLMTSLTTLLACACLMFFGWGTVMFSFGLIMSIGIVIGTYSSVYVASPAFMFLREQFAPVEREVKPAHKTAKERVVV